MFENYEATDEDLKTIEEGIQAVWRPEMDFVFTNRDLIKHVTIISYDSNFLYIWVKNKLSNKFPHHILLKDEWQMGWRTDLPIKPFTDLLPSILQKSKFETPIISGGLLTPFSKLQQSKGNIVSNPYTTRESYLATIVHEFGHVYYQQHKTWWYSNLKENLNYLENALKLFSNKKGRLSKIRIPHPSVWSEVFAFCTDYYASGLFWPKHQRNVDEMNAITIKNHIPTEEIKNLEEQDSLFDDENFTHLTAAVFGKIILTRYPNLWPRKLLKLPTI